MIDDYMFQIIYLDQEEHKYIQQGHCNDVSAYSFSEIMNSLLEQ